MCQAVRDGGRRCPKHQHHNIVATNLASLNTGLTQRQVETVFRKLRSEARGKETITPEQFRQLNSYLRLSTPDERREWVEKELAKTGEVTADHLDGASAHATRNLLPRARQMAANLQKFLRDEGLRTGHTTAEMERLYQETMLATDVSRGADTPETFTLTTRAWAERKGLPYDRASVVATETLKALPSPERAENPRITEHVPVDGGRWFQKAGYHDGRLELIGGQHGSADGEHVLIYQNIPAEMFQTLVKAPAPTGYYLHNIFGKEEYQYDDEAEADHDRYAYKCPSCGQFASLRKHTCPNDEAREDAAANNQPMPVTGEDGTSDPAANPVVPAGHPLPRHLDIYESPAAGSITPPTVQSQLNPPKALATWSEEAVPPWRRDANAHLFNEDGIPTPESGIAYQEYEHQFIRERNHRAVIRPVVYRSGEMFSQFLSEVTDQEEREQAAASVKDDGRLWFWSRIEQTSPERKNWYKLLAVREEANIQPFMNESYARDWSYGFVDGTPRSIPFYRDELAGDKAAMKSEHADERARLDALLDNDQAAFIPTTHSSVPQSVIVDDQLQRGQTATRLKVSIGSATVIRETLNAGKVAILPVSFVYKTAKQNRHRRIEQALDDQNIPLTVANGDGYRVGGTIAVARNPEGVIVPLTGPGQLRCNCEHYRSNYHCAHIDHALRHVGNAVQQQVVKKTRVVNPDAATRDKRLTAYFHNKGWDKFQTDPATGEEYIPIPSGQVLFHTTRGNFRIPTSTTEWTKLPSTEQLQNLSPEEQVVALAKALDQNYSASTLLSYIRQLQQASQIRSALKKTSVEVPIRSISAYGATWGLSGTVRFGQTDNPSDTSTLKAVSHNIKCECPDYRENYDCIHVRMFVSHAGAILWDSRVNPENDPNPPAREAYSNTSRIQREVREATSTYSDDSVASRLYPDPGPDATEDELRQVAKNRFLLAYATGAMRTQLGDAYHESDGTTSLVEKARQLIDEHEEEWEVEGASFQRSIVEDVTRTRSRREKEAKDAELAAVAEKAADSYRQARLKAWEQQDSRYSDNYNQFVEDYEQARRPYRSKKGTSLPFIADGNVTDGICAPGGRGFGVEMEFTFQEGISQAKALQAIAAELYAEGLTDRDVQSSYHHAAVEGYSSNKWSFEEDETVAGELVSPILHDTPEAWEQVRKVCEIVKKHGGSAGTRAVGSHVNIGTGSYGRNAGKHRELVRSVNQHEDVLFRLATNPHRGIQRGTKWCSPLREEDTAGDVTSDVAAQNARWFGFENGTPSHGEVVNLTNSGNQAHNSRVEFRLWDGTLDPAVIQRQVAISAALVDAAEMHVTREGKSSPRSKEQTRQLGQGYEASQKAGREAQTAAGQDGQRGAAVEIPTAEDAGLRNAAELFDRIFRTSAERQRAVELLAVTNWQQMT